MCSCSVPALNLTSDTALTQAQNPDLVPSTSFPTPGVLIEVTKEDGSVISSFVGVLPPDRRRIGAFSVPTCVCLQRDFSAPSDSPLTAVQRSERSPAPSPECRAHRNRVRRLPLRALQSPVRLLPLPYLRWEHPDLSRTSADIPVASGLRLGTRSSSSVNNRCKPAGPYHSSIAGPQ